MKQRSFALKADQLQRDVAWGRGGCVGSWGGRNRFGSKW